MRIFSLFAVLVLTAFATSAKADDWSKTYDLTGKPELRVESSDASVRIESWDQNRIEAHLTTRGWKIGNQGLEVVEHQQSNSVEIQIRQRHHSHISFGIDSQRAELEIHMPRSARLDVHTDDDSIWARGREGELKFTTSDGKLELEAVDGSPCVHTSDGSVRVSGRFDVLELETGDGHVEIEARPGSQLKQPWEIRSSDGSIKLRVPGDLAADVELHTSDGHITTDVPIVVQGGFDKRDVRGKMNGGGNRLIVHTSDGSITLERF